jgi:hypothetical protein
MNPLDASVNEIRSQLDESRRHFLYSDGLSRKVLRALNQDALVHSDHLEPGFDHKATLARLKNAWERGLSQYSGRVTERLILDLSQIIDFKNKGGYRNATGFTIDRTGNRVFFTNPAKISRDLGAFLDSLGNFHEDPIVQAAQLHLYTAIIHPLNDGNGRTSRLVQNLILHHEGIPPAIIKSTERFTYLSHLEDAHRGFKDRDEGLVGPFDNPSYPEIRFLQYVLDRVKDATGRLSDEILSQRRYEVDVKMKGTPKNIYGLRNAIRNSLGSRGISPSFDISPKSGLMTVVTRASEEEMIGIIEKYKSRSPTLLKYDIADTTNKQ